MEVLAAASILDESRRPLFPTSYEYDMLWGDSTRRKPMSPLASFIFIAIIVGIMIAAYSWFSYLGSKEGRRFWNSFEGTGINTDSLSSINDLSILKGLPATRRLRYTLVLPTPENKIGLCVRSHSVIICLWTKWLGTCVKSAKTLRLNWLNSTRRLHSLNSRIVELNHHRSTSNPSTSGYSCSRSVSLEIPIGAV
jgi:hypothetical protein